MHDCSQGMVSSSTVLQLVRNSNQVLTLKLSWRVKGNPVQVVQQMGNKAGPWAAFFATALSTLKLDQQAAIQGDVQAVMAANGSISSALALRFEPSSDPGLVLGLTAQSPYGKGDICAVLGGQRICELGCGGEGSCSGGQRCLLGAVCVQCVNDTDCAPSSATPTFCRSLNIWSMANSETPPCQHAPHTTVYTCLVSIDYGSASSPPPLLVRLYALSTVPLAVLFTASQYIVNLSALLFTKRAFLSAVCIIYI